MKNNFTCPKCKSKQRLSKKLHGTWTCPKCHNTIIPTDKIVSLGYVPYRKSAFSYNNEQRKPFVRKPFEKKSFNKSFKKENVNNG